MKAIARYYTAWWWCDCYVLLLMRMQEELFRDNLSRLYEMKDELEKTYRSQLDLVHSRYRGIWAGNPVAVY